MATKITPMRLKDDTVKQLDYLCKAYGVNRTQFVTAQIQAQYDKLQGSPLMLEMLGQLNSLTAKLKEQAKQLDSESSQTNGKA